jgi:hypothetical protein
VTAAKLNVLITLILVVAAACGSVQGTPTPDAPPDNNTVLAPPTGVMATANIDLGARLTWTAPSSGTVTGYTVTASPAGGTTQVNGTQAIVTGLTAAQSYTFTVTATYANGMATSDPSNAVTIVAGPAAPANVFTCGANASATIRATAVAGAASYNIYYGTDPMPSKFSTMKASTPTLPYAQTGLTNGTKLYYMITAVDANGVESADSAIDSTTPDSAVHDAVFGSSYNSANQSIEIIDCVSKYATGVTASARVIKGAATGILTSYYNTVALDPANALIYYHNPTSVLVFGDATHATGNIAPTRTITSSALTAVQGGIALDTTRNILYVGNGANTILVFTNASTANGATTPARTITASGMTSMYGIAIDTVNDRLYVANYANVQVLNNASIISGAVTPNRTITTAGIAMSNIGVAIDTTNDLLYIGARDAGTISTVAASTANGATTPIRSISGINTPMGLFHVNNRVLAMSDNSATQIMYWDNANAANGAVAPVSVKFPTLTATSGFAYAP